MAVLILFERRSDLLLQSGGGATERMDQNEKKENIGFAVHHMESSYGGRRLDNTKWGADEAHFNLLVWLGSIVLFLPPL